jgi:glycosyltransferase involved in cell wall biosynthesis
MKILVLAHGCSSRGGSEGYFGWSAVRCLAQDHDVWVLTSSRNESDLQEAQSEGLVSQNAHFIFLGGPFKPWPANQWIARLQSWQEYWAFSILSLSKARELHQRIAFDLVHHVTIATWRISSSLWKLKIPFVFGPVGGAEQFPFRFFSILSGKAKAFELLRMLSNTVSRISPAVRACLRNASIVLGANLETVSLVKKIRGADSNVSLLNPGFYSSPSIKSFSRFVGQRAMNGPLRLFAGGNLEGRKGIALALRALALAKEKGMDFRYRLGGGGPEQRYLEQLTCKLGLRDHVIFGTSLKGEAYREELGATHILLLPSLRENVGLTMMEAMLAGCMPIVADCGGPALIVTEECGYKLPVSNREEMVRRLAELILSLDRNREIIITKGRASSERIASSFSEAHYREAIGNVYAQVTAGSRN